MMGTRKLTGRVSRNTSRPGNRALKPTASVAKEQIAPTLRQKQERHLLELRCKSGARWFSPNDAMRVVAKYVLLLRAQRC
eukprot:2156472-Rhodomonas_salina.5